MKRAFSPYALSLIEPQMFYGARMTVQRKGVRKGKERFKVLRKMKKVISTGGSRQRASICAEVVRVVI